MAHQIRHISLHVFASQRTAEYDMSDGSKKINPTISRWLQHDPILDIIRDALIRKQIWFRERLTWNPDESLVCDVSRQLNMLHQAASCSSCYDIRDIVIHVYSNAHSPFLFNFVIDEIMRRTLEGLQNPGVQIACDENLVDLKHADDIILVFREEEKAQMFLDELTKVLCSDAVKNKFYDALNILLQRAKRITKSPSGLGSLAHPRLNELVDMDCTRIIARVTWYRNETISKRVFGCATGTSVNECTQHQKLRWLGHVLRIHRLSNRDLFHVATFNIRIPCRIGQQVTFVRTLFTPFGGLYAPMNTGSRHDQQGNHTSKQTTMMMHPELRKPDSEEFKDWGRLLVNSEGWGIEKAFGEGKQSFLIAATSTDWAKRIVHLTKQSSPNQVLDAQVDRLEISNRVWIINLSTRSSLQLPPHRMRRDDRMGSDPGRNKEIVQRTDIRILFGVPPKLRTMCAKCLELRALKCRKCFRFMKHLVDLAGIYAEARGEAVHSACGVMQKNYKPFNVLYVSSYSVVASCVSHVLVPPFVGVGSNPTGVSATRKNNEGSFRLRHKTYADVVHSLCKGCTSIVGIATTVHSFAKDAGLLEKGIEAACDKMLKSSGLSMAAPNTQTPFSLKTFCWNFVFRKRV
ncbi:polyprotein [Clonorchis sinensis]|uniref:Polyprotein n=1 Tax=Clonorchis sinensis TaxID=79923 RepID=G7YS74_CLOSI|nr:polyprotein [Clonorchis sinensis]